MRVPPEEFEALVEAALEGLPEELAELLENVAVMVEEEPDPEDLEALEMEPDEELFGLYQGVPLAERDSFYNILRTFEDTPASPSLQSDAHATVAA